MLSYRQNILLYSLKGQKCQKRRNGPDFFDLFDHFDAFDFFKILVLFLCFLPGGIRAEETIKFRNISIDQGLSQTTVFDITQDKNGNLWIATADGLNKYDSYTFTVYRHKRNDSLSIANNLIRTVYKDSSHTIWIGTPSGLSRYDSEKDCFYNYTLTSEKEKLQVFAIGEVDSLRLILATSSGIRFFDKARQAFTSRVYLPGAKATTLAPMGRQILIGTQQGLYLYTPGSEKISPIVKELQLTTINTIQYIPYKGFWVGTEGDGLYFVDPTFRISRVYRHKAPSAGRSISSDFVRTLCLDYEQRLWVGTFTGLNLYNATTGAFDTYYHDLEDNSTISQNSIRTIFPDNQGGIWLGTYFCGLDYYHPLQNRFGLLRQNLKDNSLKDNVISCIVEEQNTGNLWIGTNDGGVNYYNPRQRRYSYFQMDEKKSYTLKSNNIKCILPDHKGNAWVGTHGGGLSYIHRATGFTETYLTSGSGISSNNVYALLEGTDKHFWVGTLNGLQSFDPSGRTFSVHPVAVKNPELKEAAVFYLFKDSRHRIWIGTDKKVFVHTPETGQTEIVLSLANEGPMAQIFCIQESKDHSIWIGTRNGLYKTGPEKGQYRIYTTADGLPNDVVYGILEDSYGHLWLSTNKGLSCFDVRNQTFRNYTESDGIQSNQFNNYAFCKTAQGRMYFGGVKGITYFNPEHLQDNPFTPQAILSRLTLFNREITPGDASGILRQSISQTRKLKFRAAQNFFGLHFSAPNFLSAQKNTFQYKLEGFDKDWYTTTNPEVSYSNLSPGTYTFKLNVANNDGKWSPQTTVLEIEILPAWYQSWWFILILALIVVFTGLAVFKYYKTRLQLRQNEELNQTKIRFFVNITHELRTPLTLIISPIREILERGITDKWMRGQIEYIQRSANRLLNLVNQTLDYRRAELGVFELKVRNRSAETLAHDIFMLFSKYAAQRNINYQFISNVPDKHYPLDINYLERILLNLLSNAFKYTPESGNISVVLNEEDGKLLITISDSGCGIAKEEQEKIFERFYHICKDQMSSGIGLSLVKILTERHHGCITLVSSPGEGASFCISLPARPEAYAPQEWDHSGQDKAPDDIPLALSDLTAISAQTPPRLPEDQTAEKQEETILLVDDDETILNYLADNLKNQYHVLTASNGQEGMALVKEHPVDLIVTDIMMPGMDGIKFCKAIKQNINTSHIYVLMLTAKNDIDNQLEGLHNGADDYLSKPFVFSVLNAKITNLLRARRRMKHHFLAGTNPDISTVGFNAADEALLQKCRAIIEKNMDQADFSVDELSREMGMSRSTLHLKLKSITGASTIEFIRKIKFGKACQLLQDGRYSIAEISTMVGFSTPSYFASSFKKQIGCLPNEYLKKKDQRSKESF